jgi:hypothetical protein
VTERPERSEPVNTASQRPVVSPNADASAKLSSIYNVSSMSSVKKGSKGGYRPHRVSTTSIPPSHNHVQLHRSLDPRSQVYFLLYPHIPPYFCFPERRRCLHSWLYRTRGTLRACTYEMGRPWLCRLHLRPARLWSHSTRPQEVGKRSLRSDGRRRPDF